MSQRPDACIAFLKVEGINSHVRGGAASWEGGAVDGGSVNAFLAAALARVMSVAGPIPALAPVSVLQSAPVGGSVVGVVGFGELLWGLGSSTAANWVSFDLNVSCSSC